MSRIIIARVDLDALPGILAATLIATLTTQGITVGQPDALHVARNMAQVIAGMEASPTAPPEWEGRVLAGVEAADGARKAIGAWLQKHLALAIADLPASYQADLTVPFGRLVADVLAGRAERGSVGEPS